MYRIEVSVNELENGHAKLRIDNREGYRLESEFSDLQEALDEAWKTLARERIKWRS